MINWIKVIAYSSFNEQIL